MAPITNDDWRKPAVVRLPSWMRRRERIENPPLWLAILLRLTRAYWISRIDYVLSEAKQAGRLNNDLLHELDARLKYTPTRPWPDPYAARKAAS